MGPTPKSHCNPGGPSTPCARRPGSQEQGLSTDGDNLGTPVVNTCPPTENVKPLVTCTASHRPAEGQERIRTPGHPGTPRDPLFGRGSGSQVEKILFLFLFVAVCPGQRASLLEHQQDGPGSPGAPGAARRTVGWGTEGPHCPPLLLCTCVTQWAPWAWATAAQPHTSGDPLSHPRRRPG